MKLAVAITAFSLAFPALATACEAYKSVPQDQAQTMLDTLGNPRARSLERVFAFQTLACSDIPAIRQASMEQGLKNVNDPILRGQVLLEILMQKDAINLDLLDSPNLSPMNRDFIKRRGGSMLYTFRFKDRAQGCISIGYNDRCDATRKVTIAGDRIQMLDGNQSAHADLQLQPDNTLRGLWKRRDDPPIPVRVTLF